jgi:alpha-galactosidase
MGMLRKLVPPTGVAARFPNDALDVGIVELPGKRAYCVLNWGDSPRTFSLPLDAPGRATELWTGETVGPGPGGVPVTLGARDGRVFITT